MIERKGVDAVIVYASDRLSRKLAHVLVLREEFQRAEMSYTLSIGASLRIRQSHA